MEGVQPVPPKFFLEVKRGGAPFWNHPSLKPLDIKPTQTGDREGSSENAHVLHELEVDDGIERGNSDSDDDDDEYFVDVGREGQTFDETVEWWIRTMREFADSLDYQRQFRDGRMLQALEREGAGFKRLMTAYLTKERRMRNTRGNHPSKWEQETGRV